MNFDLNINNYKLNELIDLFELPELWNLDILEIKENKLKNALLNNNTINPSIREYTINFINEAKNQIINNYSELKKDNDSKKSNDSQELNKILNQEKIKKNLNSQQKDNKINFVGTIINPLSNQPVLETQSIINNQINGYNYKSTITNYVFNTQFRDNYFNTISSDCNFTLPLTIKNVISISLSACQFPNVIYGFSNSNQTNELFIHENGTNKEAIVVIPEGNYDIGQFCSVLEDNINLQVCNIPISTTKLNYRFFVSYNAYTYLVTISNLFYTFEMNTLKKNTYDVSCINQIYNDNLNKDNTNSINDNCILPGDLFKTMGYIIGFRDIEYSGKSSYTAESTFNNKYTSYIYFCLNEFCNTQQNTTYGMFPTSLINNSILALIPITSAQFTTTFDSNANFIYKTRVYGGPIDISKINIKILNQYGTIAELHKRDFAFSLQVTTIYDNTIPYSF